MQLHSPRFLAAGCAILCGILSYTLASQFAVQEQVEAKMQQNTYADLLVVSPIREEQWNQFLTEKYTLVRKEVTFTLPEHLAYLKPEGWTISLMEHANWIILRQDKERMWASLDPKILQKFLDENVASLLPVPSHAVITKLPEAEGLHAEVEGAARDGWKLVPTTVQTITQSVDRGVLALELPVEFVQGTVRGTGKTGIGSLTLLSRGRSNFTNSIPNRIFNINKTMNEHLNHVFIPPQATFSFNDTLGGRVSVANGWRLSMGIFDNGATLRETPGGGICQASTTTFRALAAAGLPVSEKSNHTMYISYYRDYGEGIDAAIYPPGKNLVAQNTTPGPLYFQAYTEGNDAYVEIYGIVDRSVKLEGPYRYNDKNEKVIELLGRNLGTREVAWVQTVIHEDETVEEKLIKSYYVTEVPYYPSKLAGKLPEIMRSKKMPAIVSVAPKSSSLKASVLLVE